MLLEIRKATIVSFTFLPWGQNGGENSNAVDFIFLFKRKIDSSDLSKHCKWFTFSDHVVEVEISSYLIVEEKEKNIVLKESLLHRDKLQLDMTRFSLYTCIECTPLYIHGVHELYNYPRGM